MDDSDFDIDNQDYQDAGAKGEMELDNTTDCNQNISHDTSATLVSSDNPGDEDEENENLVEGGVTLENSPELESEKYHEEEQHFENDGQELTSSSSSSPLSEGSSRRRRVRPSLSAEAEVVKYIKTRVVPYKPSSNPNPNISLERRVMRAARPFRPREDSQSSGQLSEASSCTGSSQSSSQTYRVSGRFECPGDTEDEAEVKSQIEHKEDPCRFHDKKKRDILMHIFGSQIRFRNQDRESRMSTNSGDSDVGPSETPCECPPEEAKDTGECCGSRLKEESYGATGYDSDYLEGAKGSEKGRKRYKSDHDYEQEVQEEAPEVVPEEEQEEEQRGDEFEYIETESEDGVDYDKKNDYNDYAYNLSCLEDSDD